MVTYDTKVAPVVENVVKKVLTKEEQAKVNLEEKGMMNRLFEMNKPEQKYFYIGTVFAFINGAIFPFCGFLLGMFVDILSRPENPNFRSEANMLAIYFIILASISWVCTIIQQGIFTR